LERLSPARGDNTTFFAFANTVATRSYTRKEEGQGWIGIRLQITPRDAPSEIIVHVRLLDPDPVREQEALGILGVNLIYSAFFADADPVTVIRSLRDGLSSDRVDIDMIKFSGAAFARVDNRLMSLQLVEQGLTDAAMFTAAGETVIPGEILYKQPVVVERGSFRPLTNPMREMLGLARDQFIRDHDLAGATPVTLLEMTLKHLQVGATIDHQDFLDRVDTLRALELPVLISNFRRYHRLVQLLSRHNSQMIGLPLGLARLRDVLDESNYGDLAGGLMESLGQLFRAGVKLYVYPWFNRETGKIITLENFQPAPGVAHLYAHLRANGFIKPIHNFTPEYPTISSTGVLESLQAGDAKWERGVPGPVAEVIKTKKLFGCK
jgi:hypothetical protein